MTFSNILFGFDLMKDVRYDIATANTSQSDFKQELYLVNNCIEWNSSDDHGGTDIWNSADDGRRARNVRSDISISRDMTSVSFPHQQEPPARGTYGT